MRKTDHRHHPDEKPKDDCQEPVTKRDLRDFEARILTALALLSTHVVQERCETRDVLDKVLKVATKDVKTLEKLAAPDK